MAQNISLCYLSLADAFLTRITKDVQKSMTYHKKMESGLGVEVVPVNTEKQNFIENYLQHLYVTKQGIFCKQRTFGGLKNHKQDLFVYDCERSCFSKGTSTGDPTKTRANGCRAYISFCFEEGATITLCILRYRLSHTGHNPANREECKISRIDAQLKSSIQEWAQETHRVSDILLKIAKWNKTKGNADYKDRKFFPSPQDVQQVIWSSQRIKPYKERVEINSKDQEIGVPALDSLSTLLKTKYRDMCIFYQASSYNGTVSKPLILVLQTQHQKEVFRMHGERLIFISRNYEGLKGYGCAIYSLVVKDEDDVAFPITYILSSVDDGFAFIQALHKFKLSNSAIQPKTVFMDASLVGSSDGISTIYPNAKIFIPRYQVMKSVQEWLSRSAVAEKGHKEVREVLLKYILDISNCGTELEFQSGRLELEQKVDYPEFTNMLKLDWLLCGEKWCDFGRNQMFTSTLDSFMIERLFLNLEHQLLKGLQTIYKPEDLVEHIAKDLNHNRGEQDGLIDMEDFLEGTPEEQAENLLQDGWGGLVIWQSTFVALIPSQTSTDTFFKTQLITMECECPFPPFRGLCVHLNLALMLVQRKAKEEGGENVETARIRIACEAQDNCDFLVEKLSVTTFHSGIICVTSLSDFTCTCKASFFGCECVGVILSRKLQPQAVTPPPECVEAPKEVVEYTVVSENSPPASVFTEEQMDTIDSVNEVVTSESPQKTKKTQKLIEDLFIWSQSPQFYDSSLLHTLVLKVNTEIGLNVADEKHGKGKSKRSKGSPSNSAKKSRSKALRESPRKSTRIKTSLSYK